MIQAYMQDHILGMVKTKRGIRPKLLTTATYLQNFMGTVAYIKYWFVSNISGGYKKQI